MTIQHNIHFIHRTYGLVDGAALRDTQKRLLPALDVGVRETDLHIDIGQPRGIGHLVESDIHRQAFAKLIRAAIRYTPTEDAGM